MEAGAAIAHKPSWRMEGWRDGGMASSLLRDLAHLPQSHLPSGWSHGPLVGWQELGAELPVELRGEGEGGHWGKQGINTGFRLSAALLCSGSVSPSHTSCQNVLSYS